MARNPAGSFGGGSQLPPGILGPADGNQVIGVIGAVVTGLLLASGVLGDLLRH